MFGWASISSQLPAKVTYNVPSFKSLFRYDQVVTAKTPCTIYRHLTVMDTSVWKLKV